MKSLLAMQVGTKQFLLSLLLVVAFLDTQIRYVMAQGGATTTIAVTAFTDLTVNGQKVWVILAGVGGAVGFIIFVLLIMVCCAFAKRGSKVAPPGVESGGYYIVDPDRFPSVEVQTDYHPAFAPLTHKVDCATMTKRSMWSPIQAAAEENKEDEEPAPEPPQEEGLPEHTYMETSPYIYSPYL